MAGKLTGQNRIEGKDETDMATNDSKTRMARVAAMDLGNGDVIVNVRGRWVATVDSVPELDLAADRVRFVAVTPDDSAKTISYQMSRVVRLSIGRRTS